MRAVRLENLEPAGQMLQMFARKRHGPGPADGARGRIVRSTCGNTAGRADRQRRSSAQFCLCRWRRNFTASSCQRQALTPMLRRRRLARVGKLTELQEKWLNERHRQMPPEWCLYTRESIELLGDATATPPFRRWSGRRYRRKQTVRSILISGLHGRGRGVIAVVVNSDGWEATATPSSTASTSSRPSPGPGRPVAEHPDSADLGAGRRRVRNSAGVRAPGRSRVLPDPLWRLRTRTFSEASPSSSSSI